MLFIGMHVHGPNVVTWVASDGSGYETEPCGCCPDSARYAK